jgi:hypothetical protein
MMRDLAQTADRCCWISGDRVNVCIGYGPSGIVEFGFHGMQPVSRNSRLLVWPGGVVSLALRGPDGGEVPVSFGIVDHQPHAVIRKGPSHGGHSECEVVAADRAVHVFLKSDVPDVELIVRCSLEAQFSDVRGERTWDAPRVHGSWLTLCCRDRLELGPWMKHTGPYAGDFLIPEHWRRMIFTRPIRSGLATPGDLRPEYRDVRVSIYDARTWIVMGCRRSTVSMDGASVTFVVPVDPSGHGEPAFSIAGSESDPAGTEEAVTAHAPVGQVRQQVAAANLSAPQLSCAQLPELSTFFGTVPAVVRSCTVSDVGMTRATPGAYYWLWAWDNLVTGQECLRWGANDLAGSMIRYVHGHRDTDGRIPARWTRSHEPMDTPPHGALDFLHLQLTYEQALASGVTADLLSIYPHAAAHLRQSMAADQDGLVPGLSFYPDRPVAFGRTDRSVVALETGCLYSFARLMDNVAGLIGDHSVRRDACLYAHAIEAVFTPRFWDAPRGFLVDSYDRVTGQRNETCPLFTLLFLQYAPGMHLLRGMVPAMGRFMVEQLQTSIGVRMLSAQDKREAGEDALGSWYPHWDIYLLKVLRRAGNAEAIVRWARAAEFLLTRLGYVPEFIALDGLTEMPGPGWLRHGAVSNLNCVTGWHRAIVEGLCGIELDPGGMSVVPLNLEIGPIVLRGYNVRGTTWDFAIDHAGPHLQEIRIDGELLQGCLKVPARFHDRGHHELSVRYGAVPRRVAVRELLNAELLDSRTEGSGTLARLRALGMTDIVIDDPGALRCLLDGVPAELLADPVTGQQSLRIEDPGVHELEIVLLS